MANSSQLSFPRRQAPACQRRSVTPDSYGGTKPCRIALHALVVIPSVQNISFTPKGIPSRTPASPFSKRWSLRCAISRARSEVSKLKALSVAASSAACRWACASSCALISPARRAARARCRLQSVTSFTIYSNILGTTKQPSWLSGALAKSFSRDGTGNTTSSRAHSSKLPPISEKGASFSVSIASNWFTQLRMQFKSLWKRSSSASSREIRANWEICRTLSRETVILVSMVN